MPGKGAEQQIANAVGLIGGQQNKNIVLLCYQVEHSFVKKFQGCRKILLREKKPFGRTGTAGGFKSDNPGYAGLGDTEEVERG